MKNTKSLTNEDREYLRQAGELDAEAGLPIDSFYKLPLARFTEIARAQYEIGFRAAKRTLLTTPK